MDQRFSHIRNWIFDLDNCLYPASAGLFELVDQRMGAYIQQLLSCDAVEARRVQKLHFHTHGTTLAGLRIREIDEAVRREVRIDRHVEQAALLLVHDLRHAGERLRHGD